MVVRRFHREETGTFLNALEGWDLWTTAEFATLRLKLIKIAARVIEMASRVRLAFAAACPNADFFASLPAVLMSSGP